MTAISAADGYARVTGAPQAVVVHVDVGTQALAHGVHNASVGRSPVLVVAGMCPSTEDDASGPAGKHGKGGLKGARTEYSNWLQDVPDQTAIVRQYCRHVAEVRRGRTVKQVVGRALQFAGSAPRGPSYVVASREVLAEELLPLSEEGEGMKAALDQSKWGPIGPGALPDDAARDIARSLRDAERPVVVTGYSGRDPRTPGLLVQIAEMVPALRVQDTGGSEVCFPATHPAFAGSRFSHDGRVTKEADVVLVLDCDVPWIPARNPPREDATVWHVDCDPLNQQLQSSFFPAHGRWRADNYTALGQLVGRLEGDEELARRLREDPVLEARREKRAREHEERRMEIAGRVKVDDPEQGLDAHNVGYLLRTTLPESTTFVLEGVTAAENLHDQLAPSQPGSLVGCFATGIGWSNGAALGVRMGLKAKQQEETPTAQKPVVVCQIVGDGSFMCGSPASALWTASKYRVPVLTVLLNNGGWKAPRNSARLVYPEGLSATATDDEVGTSIAGPTPHYARLAEAGAGSWQDGENGEDGWMKAVRVRTVGELNKALKEAGTRVGEEEKGMFIEVLM